MQSRRSPSCVALALAPLERTQLSYKECMYLQKRVDDLSKGAYGHKWKGCDVYKSYQAMLEDVLKEKRPDAMIIGVPPMLHGEQGTHEQLLGIFVDL